MTNPHAKAIEAAARAMVNRVADEFGFTRKAELLPGNIRDAQAAVTAYLAAMAEAGFSFVNTRQITVTEGLPLCIAARPKEDV